MIIIIITCNNNNNDSYIAYIHVSIHINVSQRTIISNKPGIIISNKHRTVISNKHRTIISIKHRSDRQEQEKDNFLK